MKYLVNWIPLNTHVRFENQPCLKGGPEPPENEIHDIFFSKSED